MSLVHPRYIVKDTSQVDGTASSVPVLRASDSRLFLASKIPRILARDDKEDTHNTPLATVVLPVAGLPISRILNHPNIISIIDITHTSILPGSISQRGEYGDITVWEDMDAGCLSYLLPDTTTSLPALNDKAGWALQATQNFQRFSLPESLCWHVLRSISKALMWLHHGVKETIGIPGEYESHDSDWQPILIMDVSPGQIWFQQPKGFEFYGSCKLGGFQYARVTGITGGKFASAQRIDDVPEIKKYYWAPEVYRNLTSVTRASEIWSLGATIYHMMTGIPPPRDYDYNWQVSRMNDRGFSQGLRGIIKAMLKHDPTERPTSLKLVDRVEDEWRHWRATTQEGREFIDVWDEALARRVGEVGG